MHCCYNEHDHKSWWVVQQEDATEREGAWLFKQLWVGNRGRLVPLDLVGDLRQVFDEGLYLVVEVVRGWGVGGGYIGGGGGWSVVLPTLSSCMSVCAASVGWMRRWRCLPMSTNRL